MLDLIIILSFVSVFFFLFLGGPNLVRTWAFYRAHRARLPEGWAWIGLPMEEEVEQREKQADRLLYEVDPELAVELGYHVPSCTCEACGGPK